MQGRKAKRIFAQSVLGDVKYFNHIDDAVRYFGHSRGVLYSAIDKGTGVKKNFLKWYLDFAINEKSDLYGDD